MAECNHDCSNCSQAGNCSDQIQKAKLNDRSHIKKIVGVLSGKGGVGKSYITSLLAVYLNRHGYRVGIMDADITGPSIPKAFGIKDKAYGEDGLIFPLLSKGGIKVISANCLLENESDPIVWRGSSSFFSTNPETSAKEPNTPPPSKIPSGISIISIKNRNMVLIDR